MKKLVIFLVLLLAVLAIAYLIATRKSEKLLPQKLASEKAILVFETSKVGPLLKQLEREYLMTLFKDSISQKIPYKIDGLAISLNEISPNDFGIAVYFRLSKGALAALQRPADKRGLKITTRIFNGIDIVEVHFAKQKVFSYCVMDDLLVGSEVPLLLEDAIRIRTTNSEATFFNRTKAVKTVKSDTGVFTINLQRTAEATSSFLLNKKAFTHGVGLSGVASLDLKLNKNSIVMNGFASDSIDGGSSLLTLFDDQKPVFFQMRGLIPNETGLLTQYGISDFKLWRKRQMAFLKSNNAGKALSEFHQNFPVENVFSCLGDELAICQMKSGRGADLFIIEVNDWDKLQSILKIAKADSAAVEQYANTEIRLLKGEHFTDYIFWPLMPEMKQSYYIHRDKYWIIADNTSTLKGFMDAVDSDNTWGKSVEFEKFFESTLQESNINFLFRGDQLEDMLMTQLKPKWRNVLDTSNFFGIRNGSIQFSRLDKEFYANVNLERGAENNIKRKRNRSVLALTNKVTNGPFLVYDANEGVHEFFVQDTTNTLYLLSNGDKVKWSVKLKEQVRGAIHQIDYLNNGKYQCLIPVKGNMYLIDRLGRVVDDFPKELPDKDVASCLVIDYDRSKNYRLLLTSTKQGLALFDKHLKPVEGWQPKAFADELLATPEYYRIGGKDYLLVVTKKGEVNLYNRRGELVKYFPVHLDMALSGGYWVDKGGTLSESILHLITKEGMKVQMNLEGHVLSKESLVRNNNSVFSLIKAKNADSYCVFRIDKNKIAFFAMDGSLLFELENPGSEILRADYYDLPKGNKVFSLFDPTQNYSHLYNEKGVSLTPYPVESTLPVVIDYNAKSQEMKACVVANKTVQFLSLTELVKAH